MRSRIIFLPSLITIHVFVLFVLVISDLFCWLINGEQLSQWFLFILWLIIFESSFVVKVFLELMKLKRGVCGQERKE